MTHYKHLPAINVAKIWCKLSDFIFLSPQRDVLWLNIKHAGARCPSNNAQFILTQRCGSTRGGGCGQELCVRPHFAKWRTLVRFVNISLICENWSDLRTLFRFVIFIVWSKKQIYYEMMMCWNVSGWWYVWQIKINLHKYLGAQCIPHTLFSFVRQIFVFWGNLLD